MKNISYRQLGNTILVLASITVLVGPSSVLAADSGFKGEYFSNPNLLGEPVLVRVDPEIKFNWAETSPGPGIPVDNFSVRWTKNDDFKEGTYKFVTKTDDGVRLYIDDQLIIDKWVLQTPTNNEIDHYVKAGSHAIKMEFFEGPNQAIAELSYFFVSPSTPTPAVQSTPTPSPASTPTPTPTITPVPQGGTGQLPKTGLPPIAWAAAAFIPIGLKLRQFSKSRGNLEDTPHYNWEERQHKSIDNK